MLQGARRIGRSPYFIVVERRREFGENHDCDAYRAVRPPYLRWPEQSDPRRTAEVRAML